ncbi:MAG: ribonuclease HI family protein [Candidatus Micrarchaeota archaeon]|nr:ribonuclease HI family protein [Candidatus Micrarchaeota archaeon]MDE1859401.1 ribonuclease HI family protein [Candidatus Micrarchaeota archaeon]
MIINIYTDGASRNNPGKSASGYLILDSDETQLLKKSFYNGIKTNNVAEYLAIIAALESAAEEYGYDIQVNLYSDSQLAISQLDGKYKVKSAELKKLNHDALELLKQFAEYTLHNVPRENPHIVEVDADLNLLLDKY